MKASNLPDAERYLSESAKEYSICGDLLGLEKVRLVKKTLETKTGAKPKTN
jgi:hypothetical protein